MDLFLVSGFEASTQYHIIWLGSHYLIHKLVRHLSRGIVSDLHYIKEFKRNFVEGSGVSSAGIVYSGLNTFPLYVGKFH